MNPIFERIDLRRTFQNAKICNGEFEFLQKEKKESILPIIVNKRRNFTQTKLRIKKEFYSNILRRKRDMYRQRKGFLTDLLIAGSLQLSFLTKRRKKLYS